MTSSVDSVANNKSHVDGRKALGSDEPGGTEQSFVCSEHAALGLLVLKHICAASCAVVPLSSLH